MRFPRSGAEPMVGGVMDIGLLYPADGLVAKVMVYWIP